LESLCAWAIERAESFPRKVKFSLGERFIEANLRVVECLVEAAYTRDKRAALLAASRALVRARVVARLAQRLRALSNDQLHYFDGESVVVGRMVGGWLRYVNQRDDAAEAAAAPARRSRVRRYPITRTATPLGLAVTAWRSFWHASATAQNLSA
jgi:hypothetical protein